MRIEQEIEAIKERNARVESDKTWETSIFRRTVITAGTYAIALWWLYTIGNTQPLFNAAVPAGGYLLSTLALPILKNWWLQYKK